MPLTKAQQIKGLKKAIENKKTPRQFIPSMKKRLAKLTGTAALILAMLGCLARPVAAQTPVIIAPQQQTLANSGTACTGTAQTFAVRNRNQTLHFATASANSAVTSFQFVIQGIDTLGNVFTLSDVGQIGGTITGSGYFPTVQVQVTCLPATTGTFSLSYSGGSSTAISNTGSFLESEIDKLIFRTVAQTASQTTSVITTPFGTSSGRLLVQYGGLPSGSTGTIQVNCQGSVTLGAYDNLPFTLANTTSVQKFTVAAVPCPQFSITYVAPGTPVGGGISAEYLFDPPGLAPSLSQKSGCVSAPAGTPAEPFTVGVNSTAKIAAPSLSSQYLGVCGLIISAATAGTVQLIEGTGATCGTNTLNVSAAMNVLVGTPFILAADGPIFQMNNNGDSLCIVTAGGASANGMSMTMNNPL